MNFEQALRAYNHWRVSEGREPVDPAKYNLAQRIDLVLMVRALDLKLPEPACSLPTCHDPRKRYTFRPAQ